MEDTDIQTKFLTDDDLVKLKQSFEELDKDNKGHISTDDIRTLAQLFGQNPTETDIVHALDGLNISTPGQLQFEECRQVMESVSKPKEDIEYDIHQSLTSIIQSLRSSDGDVFRREELKLFLQTRGDEPLLQEEIDELFNDIDPEGNTDVFTKNQLIELLTTEF